MQEGTWVAMGGPAKPVKREHAIVIGAGIAGSTTAHRLAAAGWQVTVLEQANTPGSGRRGCSPSTSTG